MQDIKATPGTARQAFLAGSIDDAAVFPPTSLSTIKAVAEYVDAASGRDAWLQGSLMIPVAHIDDVLAAAGAHRLKVACVADPGAGNWLTGVAAEFTKLAEALERHSGEVRVQSIEVRIPPNVNVNTLRAALSLLPPSLMLRAPSFFFEVPLADGWRDDIPLAADAIAALNDELVRTGDPTRVGGKMRCGGPAGAPGAQQVGAFISAFAERHVSLKATDGLRRALTHHETDTGSVALGFLNVAGAAMFCERRVLDHDELIEILDDHDGGAFRLDDECFAWREFKLGTAAIERSRHRFFTSFAGCSFREPVEDLRRIGILE